MAPVSSRPRLPPFSDLLSLAQVFLRKVSTFKHFCTTTSVEVADSGSTAESVKRKLRVFNIRWHSLVRTAAKLFAQHPYHTHMNRLTLSKVKELFNRICGIAHRFFRFASVILYLLSHNSSFGSSLYQPITPFPFPHNLF